MDSIGPRQQAGYLRFLAMVRGGSPDTVRARVCAIEEATEADGADFGERCVRSGFARAVWEIAVQAVQPA